MGNIFNKVLRNDSLNNYAELRHDLDSLYHVIDKNHDNVVTKDEMENWAEGHKKDLEKLEKERIKLSNKLKKVQNEYKDQLAKKEEENIKLKQDLETAKQKAEELHHYVDTLLEQIDTGSIPESKIHSIISINKIDKYVEEMLKNENINIRGFPDSIEKAIYKNVFRLILLILSQISEKTGVDIIGHHIGLIIH